MATTAGDDLANSIISQLGAAGPSSNPSNVPLWQSRPKSRYENAGQFGDIRSEGGGRVTSGRIFVGPKASDYYTADYATSSFLDMSQDERDRFAAMALAAGLIKPDSTGHYDTGDVMHAWESMVNGASQYNSVRDSGQWISPWEAISKFAGRDLAGANGAVDLFKPQTTTSVNHRKFSNSDIQGSLESIFEREMGRAPKKGEIAAYRKMVQAAYDKNPEKSVQTVHPGPDGATVDTTTSGGIDVGAELLNRVRDTNESDAYQAGVTYMQAIQQAVSSPV